VDVGPPPAKKAGGRPRARMSTPEAMAIHKPRRSTVERSTEGDQKPTAGPAPLGRENRNRPAAMAAKTIPRKTGREKNEGLGKCVAAAGEKKTEESSQAPAVPYKKSPFRGSPGLISG